MATLLTATPSGQVLLESVKAYLLTVKYLSQEYYYLSLALSSSSSPSTRSFAASQAVSLQQAYTTGSETSILSRMKLHQEGSSEAMSNELRYSVSDRSRSYFPSSRATAFLSFLLSLSSAHFLPFFASPIASLALSLSQAQKREFLPLSLSSTLL